MNPASSLDQLCVNTLRFLAVDMVEQARSGHPGLPLGCAPMAYVLWSRFLRFDPRAPDWPNRDRFVLSAGHGCALLYALLHLTGFDLPLEELKRFRQWGSRTPGHPERGRTPGVEVTSGPLGQGFANAVGMAIAERALAARFNREQHRLIDHHTYVIASDGDLMEGVASEAASLAGHLRLSKLIVLYDDNRVTIEGGTQLAFTEDRLERFKAYGWHVQQVKHGNDIPSLVAAIEAARACTDRPSMIDVRTHIGFGSPHKQDSAAAHGEPLGPQEARLTKEHLGWPTEPSFLVPEPAAQQFRAAGARGARERATWQTDLIDYSQAYPDLTAEFDRVMEGRLPLDWDAELAEFNPGDEAMATRAAFGKALNAVAPRMPELIGGSADLAPSTFTRIEGSSDFEAGTGEGRNMHFGVREHAMGAVLSGIAAHGGLRPYGGTFLIFSDYMRPPIRLAAMSQLPVIYVFTHDSVGLGEDGPTHQPVEHLLALRAIPGLTVLRPADANETAAAWRVAIAQEGPVALVLTRQKLPVLDPGRHPRLREGVAKGGYVLAEAPPPRPPDITLAATGSEVHLALAARELLTGHAIRAQVVSLPSLELFAAQSAGYRRDVLAAPAPILAIEAGVTLGWRSYLDDAQAVVGIDRFGASAPGAVVMREYGLTAQAVCARAVQLVTEGRR
ncbi:MAG TPA: transketolase [Ramlibacter sp.]|nr:transketolase [Ramlibacter sp.]